MPEPGSSAELGDVLAHDELFDLYPELSEIIIEIGDDSFKDFGEFTKNKIKLNKKYFQDWVSGDPQRQRELLSTIIHEVQHAVQDREYFGMGGNSGSAYKYLPNDIFYRGIRNLSDNIRKYDLKKLTVLRDTAEVVRNSQEYKDYVEATSYTQDAWDFLVKSKEVSGDSSPTTVRAREIWSKRSDAAYEAKERLNATLGLPRFVTDDQVPKQDITDYFDLMRTVENPENTLKKITELSEDIAVLETALKTRNKDTRKKAEKIVRDDPLASIEAYQALMGEVEARDTQLRLDMTPAERRATKPYSLEGKYAPEDFAVTRYEGLPTEEAAKSRRPPTEEETTSAGFRRPVIDDRMIAEDRRLRRENALRNERELEEKYGNRYMMVDTDGEGGNKPFIDPRRPIPVRGGVNNPNIAPVTDDDAFELQSAQDILLELTEGYTPGARSWEDTKRDRSLTKGLTAGKIKNLKGVGDISLRLYQYEALQQKLSDRVTDLYYKMQTGGATPQIKAQYLETMYKFKELSAHIFDDQAEVGRALNFMKNLSLTRRKVNELNDVLREYNGSGVSAFASDDFFQEFAERVQYMINSGNPAAAANIVKQIDKPYWWQYILSARHAMMLSGLGTHAKNAYDGLMMIAREMEETTMALPLFYGRKALKAMGKDVQDGVSPQEVTARAYGLMRALLDSGTYKDTAKAFWEGHQSRSYSAKIEMQDARIPVLSKVNDALYASDTFFRAFHMNANLYTLGVRKAREDGFTGMRALEEGTANAMNPTKEMLEKARNLADVTLLVDSPSALGNMVEPSKAIRPGMKGGEQAGRFAANILFPFLRVTDRLLFQAIRRSPLSFLDKNTRAEWAAGGAERDIAIARTVYGSALMAYYWQQAGIGADQEGDVEGAGPPDYKKTQSLEATGYRPNSEVQGNKMVDITALNLSMNPLGTDNNIAAQIASIREAWERGKKSETEAEELGNQFTEVGRALLGVLASQSYAENLSTFIDPLIERDPARKETAEAAFVGGLGSQFVPAAGRQLVQQVLDPERKVTRGDGSGADRIYGRIASGIPGLSETLPDRVDALGDTMPQGRTTLGIGNYTEIKQDDVSKEIRNIERNTKKPLMTTAPSSFQLEGRTVRLTAEQQQKWNSVQGRLTREVMSIVVADPGWKKFDLATKVEFVKELRSEAYEAAKMEVLPDIDFEVQLKEEEL
jgi:flagellar motility protein MotE (MotC chaperone)